MSTPNTQSMKRGSGYSRQKWNQEVREQLDDREQELKSLKEQQQNWDEEELNWFLDLHDNQMDKDIQQDLGLDEPFEDDMEEDFGERSLQDLFDQREFERDMELFVDLYEEALGRHSSGHD